VILPRLFFLAMLVASNALIQRLTLSRRRYNLSEFNR
jgi:hypothetical protein